MINKVTKDKMINSPHDSNVNWSCKDTIWAFIASFILSIVSFLLCQNILPQYVYNLIDNQLIHYPKVAGILAILFIQILPTLILGTFSLSLVYFFVVIKHKNKFKELGFNKKGLWRNIFLGIFIGTILVLLYKLLFYYLIGGKWNINFINSYIDLLPIFNKVFIDGLFTGFWQEVFFVGFIYAAFKYRIGRFIAFFIVLVFYVLFHITHKGFVFLIPYYFISRVISISLFEKRKSIIPSIAFHSIYNILMYYL